jgi:hypothetical protein
MGMGMGMGIPGMPGMGIPGMGGTGTGAKSVQKRGQTEDDYFEEEEEPLAYIPAPGSPSYSGPGAEEDEDDPLDAFMASIESQVKKQADPEVSVKPPKPGDNRGVRQDIEEEDDEETYYRSGISYSFTSFAYDS